MIVRIMGQGQWQVPDEEVDRLNVLDDLLAQAVRDKDADMLPSILQELGDRVRKVGTPLDNGVVRLSDVILPDPHTPFDEIAAWIRDSAREEGLVPG